MGRYQKRYQLPTVSSFVRVARRARVVVLRQGRLVESLDPWEQKRTLESSPLPAAICSLSLIVDRMPGLIRVEAVHALESLKRVPPQIFRFRRG
jgi:hypothetical protein